MAKKVFIDDFYGKITMKDEDHWLLDNKLVFDINGMNQDVSVEVDIIYIKYELFRYKLFDKELIEFLKSNPDIVHAKEAKEVKSLQKELYKKYLIDGIKQTCHNIEEAALVKREEMMEDETEESFAKIVGKEKAKRVFEAKTREEKLSSLKLKKLRVFKNQIEITCTCDWFKPSGGLVIFKDGSVEMFYVDSMSI